MKTEQQRRRLINRLLALPPAKWEQFFNGIPSNESAEIGKIMDSLSLRAVELGTYAGWRSGYGCGDQGHDRAWKESRKAGKRVWTKVLGYNSY